MVKWKFEISVIELLIVGFIYYEMVFLWIKRELNNIMVEGNGIYFCVIKIKINLE